MIARTPSPVTTPLITVVRRTMGYCHLCRTSGSVLCMLCRKPLAVYPPPSLKLHKETFLSRIAMWFNVFVFSDASIPNSNLAIWFSLFRWFLSCHSLSGWQKAAVSINFSLGQWTDHSTFPLIQHWLFNEKSVFCEYFCIGDDKALLKSVYFLICSA